jgi:hypothetical protein
MAVLGCASKAARRNSSTSKGAGMTYFLTALIAFWVGFLCAVKCAILYYESDAEKQQM